MMLFAGFITLIAPLWMLPLTMGTGLVCAVRVVRAMNKHEAQN